MKSRENSCFEMRTAKKGSPTTPLVVVYEDKCLPYIDGSTYFRRNALVTGW